MSVQVSPPPVTEAPGPAGRRLGLSPDLLQKVLAFAALILLVAVFSVLSDYFFTVDTLVNILLAASVTGVLALGTTFVITTGGIDLSVGTVMTLSAVLAAQTLEVWKLPLLVGVLAALLTGLLCGLVNGLVVAVMGLPPFIATLGMFYVARGLALVISHSSPIYLTDQTTFQSISMGNLVPNLPNAVLVFFGVAVVGAVILGRTVLGRYTVSLGSNEEATRLSGVRTRRWKVAVYTLAGVFTGLAGVLIAARVGSAQPSLGAGYELDAIAAVVIGGTSLQGGEGTMLGTVIGVCITSTLTTGLALLNVPQEWQYVVTGTILVLAVYLDVLRRRRQRAG